MSPGYVKIQRGDLLLIASHLIPRGGPRWTLARCLSVRPLRIATIDRHDEPVVLEALAALLHPSSRLVIHCEPP